jgi:hypothetical protein
MSLFKFFKIPTQARKALEADHLLPDMGTFSVDDYREELALLKLFDSVDGYLTDIDNFIVTAQTKLDSPEAREWNKDKDKNEANLEKLLVLVNHALRRCCHHVLYPNRYAGLHGVIALWWRAVACFSPVSLEYADVECVDTRFKSSRYFIKKTRNDVEPPNRSRSYYDACRRLLHTFPWAIPSDKKIWAAYCDGFNTNEITVLVGEGEAYTKARLGHFIEIAKELEGTDDED